jgi:hypothetical protein
MNKFMLHTQRGEFAYYGNVGSGLPLLGTENQELYKFPYSMQYMV